MLMNCPGLKTFLAHPNQPKLQKFFQKMFQDPYAVDIEKEAAHFFANHPVTMDDFPIVEGAYSRTILYRAENRFEALGVRWSKGFTSLIHGHPSIVFDYIMEGELFIQNYEKTRAGLVKTDSRSYTSGEYFFSRGKEGAFDNCIHQITVCAECLSLHIYSDNALQGEVLTEL
jgi:hypothetical protein